MGETQRGNGILAGEHHEAEIVSALGRIVRAVDLRSRRLFEESGFTGRQLLILREASPPVTTVLLHPQQDPRNS